MILTSQKLKACFGRHTHAHPFTHITHTTVIMAGLELKAPPAAEVTSMPLPNCKGNGDKKYSIDMGAHSLEWNVTSFQVGNGKSKKNILNLVGTSICGLFD